MWLAIDKVIAKIIHWCPGHFGSTGDKISERGLEPALGLYGVKNGECHYADAGVIILAFLSN